MIPQVITLMNGKGDPRYIKITMMEPDRWVLDVMFQFGFRTTVDLRTGTKMFDVKDSLCRAIVQHGNKPTGSGGRQHGITQRSGFGDTIQFIGDCLEVAFEGEEINLVNTIEPLRWDRARFFAIIHKSPLRPDQYMDMYKQVYEHYDVEIPAYITELMTNPIC